jgi:primosomal protein N' (replication factor Y)
MLQRSSLNVLHETLSGWEWALSLLAQNAVAYLTDIDGPVATACAAGTGMALLADELRERTSLRLPPAVRIAAIDGPAAVVEEIIREVSSHESLDSLGRSRIEGTAVREIIRMPYRIAPQVAEMLRAAVVKDALSGRRGARLRVRMDDTRALDQLADGAL